MSTTSTSVQQPRRFRFRLGTLLLVVAGCGLTFGLLSQLWKEAVRRRQLEAEVQVLRAQAAVLQLQLPRVPAPRAANPVDAAPLPQSGPSPPSGSGNRQ